MMMAGWLNPLRKGECEDDPLDWTLWDKMVSAESVLTFEAFVVVVDLEVGMIFPRVACNVGLAVAFQSSVYEEEKYLPVE